MYDLHTHTDASDGVLSPEELIDRAFQAGLAGIAVTDHDTTAGIAPALEHQTRYEGRLEVIPGIEMNTEMEGCDIHILGYFIDHHDEKLLVRLEELKNSRRGRAHEMVRKLKNMGYNISFEQVRQIAKNDLIARPHIAQALLQNNHVFSIREAFDKLIGQGQPAYVPRYKFLPEEALDLIKMNGGISVLAHPGLIKDQSMISKMIAAGIQGIEVYYPDHSQEQIQAYEKIALQHGLAVTGGSDYHGLNWDLHDPRLGCCGISTLQMGEIKKLHRKMRKK